MILETPEMDKLGLEMAQEIDLGKIGDWQNNDRHPRDHNCVITYGVKGGRAFYSKTQTNMEDWVELAAMKRLAFANTAPGKRAKNFGVACYGLPEILIDEMEISGVPAREILASSDHSDLDAIMIRYYPRLLWVPASYLRGKDKRTYLSTDTIRTK